MTLAFVTLLLGICIGALMRIFYLRVQAAELCILEMLATSREPMYGLEMVARSDGLLRRGTVYVLLGRLEDRGLIESLPAPLGRRLYRVSSTRGVAK